MGYVLAEFVAGAPAYPQPTFELVTRWLGDYANRDAKDVIRHRAGAEHTVTLGPNETLVLAGGRTAIKGLFARKFQDFVFAAPPGRQHYLVARVSTVEPPVTQLGASVAKAGLRTIMKTAFAAATTGLAAKTLVTGAASGVKEAVTGRAAAQDLNSYGTVGDARWLMHRAGQAMGSSVYEEEGKTKRILQIYAMQQPMLEDVILRGQGANRAVTGAGLLENLESLLV